MSFEQALKTKKFVVTAEIFPPKGTDTASALKKSEALKDIVDAINVTDNQRAVMRMNPVVLCHQLVHKGIDAVYQMSCRDRNSMGLSSDILAASALGIKNIRLGPTLPAFVTPAVLKVLVEKFNIMPVTTAEKDLEDMLSMKVAK